MFVDEHFINKAQILKDGVVPAIKDPGHDSEQQTVSESNQNQNQLYSPSVRKHTQNLLWFLRSSWYIHAYIHTYISDMRTETFK